MFFNCFLQDPPPPPPTKFESKIVSHPFAPPLKFQDLVPPPFRGPPIDL